MNILIPHSWLKEYLKTNVKPHKIGELVSLCGPSVEMIEKVGDDFVYDIEITTNRADAMSIMGVAREANTILNRFNKDSLLTQDPYKELQLTTNKLKVKKEIPELNVKIKDQKLCSRFTAVVLENVFVKESPKQIKDKLEKVGYRSLNNVIDISNYLMHEMGQPVHVFDYEKIAKNKMILRESKKGEKIKTLDGKTHKLMGGDIVIEDGAGKLIDLCGIMGGENSRVDKNTKKILLFVQNYEPKHIRKTSMELAHRTQAATLFEKQVDPELVMPTLLKGIELLKKVANAKVASNIIDLYPEPYKEKEIKLKLQLIKEYLGVSIQISKVEKILNSLGLNITSKNKSEITVTVPSWRKNDIDIPVDIVEEIARIYGYFDLPSELPELKKVPKKPDSSFYWEDKVKHKLCSWGLIETYTNSLQSEKDILKTNLEPKSHLELLNPLSEEWVYMRTNLIPSLLSVLQNNKQQKREIKLFEISNVYLPRKNKLPRERQMLIIIRNQFSEKDYLQTKGICEALLDNLNIKFSFEPLDVDDNIWSTNKTALILSNKEVLGHIGMLKKNISKNYDLNSVTCAYLDFVKIAKLANNLKTFSPLPKYPPVIEDLTFIVPPETYAKDIIDNINKTSNLVKDVKLKTTYNNSQTYQITFQHPSQNLSDNMITDVRRKIVKNVEKTGAELKGQV